MLNFPKRKLLIVSTPYAKQGILYDHFTRFYGRDDSKDVLVWRAPTRPAARRRGLRQQSGTIRAR